MAMTTADALEGYVVQTSGPASLKNSSDGKVHGIDTPTGESFWVLYDPTTHTVTVNGVAYAAIPRYTTAGRPAYTNGFVFFDTTLDKLVIGGASGYETVTSVAQ